MNDQPLWKQTWLWFGISLFFAQVVVLVHVFTLVEHRKAIEQLEQKVKVLEDRR